MLLISQWFLNLMPKQTSLAAKAWFVRDSRTTDFGTYLLIVVGLSIIHHNYIGIVYFHFLDSNHYTKTPEMVIK